MKRIRKLGRGLLWRLHIKRKNRRLIVLEYTENGLEYQIRKLQD